MSQPIAEAPYAPWPAADTCDPPSIREDVRRMLYVNAFRPSHTHYTLVDDIYKLFLVQTSQTHSSALQDRFRSALGRVLHPPATAGAYAQSYKADVRRWRGYISLVSERCEHIDVKETVRRLKRQNAVRRREFASHSDSVKQLRLMRKQRRESAVAQGDLQQRVTSMPLSFRYVDEFLDLNCAEDLTRLKIFPNGKELAESMSAYAAVRHYLVKHAPDHQQQDGVLSFSSPNVLLVAVGDGVTPRTAALFAFRTCWKCISIDPQMRKGDWDDVKNLRTHAARVQDVAIDVADDQRVVVVMWHCHTSIADALSCLRFSGEDGHGMRLRRKVAVVSCACCNYDGVQKVMPDGSAPDAEFEDTAVPGLMRSVRVWKFLN